MLHTRYEIKTHARKIAKFRFSNVILSPGLVLALRTDSAASSPVFLEVQFTALISLVAADFHEDQIT